MSMMSILAGALLAQSAFSMSLDTAGSDRADVAYEELQHGDAEAAIAKIEASREYAQGDPAALINLGNAYARIGQTDNAFRYYRAAANASTRYDLELADGSWVDSRKAAQLALSALKRSTEQAFKD